MPERPRKLGGGTAEDPDVACQTDPARRTHPRALRTAVYGTVRTVVWEDGGGDTASYPIFSFNHRRSVNLPRIVVCTF